MLYLYLSIGVNCCTIKKKLVPGTPSFSEIQGYVFKDEGSPWEGVSIRTEFACCDSAYHHEQTAVDGSFTLLFDEARKYNLIIEPPGCKQLYLMDLKIELNQRYRIVVYYLDCQAKIEVSLPLDSEKGKIPSLFEASGKYEYIE